MATASKLSIVRHFRDLKDPRIDRTKRHLLLDIIVLSICAVVSGAEGWEDIAEYGRQKHVWLKTFLQLPHGIPSPDTIGRVFRRLKPEEFQRCFLSWAAALQEELGMKLVALDGKTARRSFDRASGKTALHLVSAWSAENHLVLGQQAVEGKSNEITAIPALLRLLELEGAIVTIDAMGCQKTIAEQIVEAGADYVLAVKDNQPTLHDAVHQHFLALHEMDFAGKQGALVRRHVTREIRGNTTTVRDYYIAPLPEHLEHLGNDWAGLNSIGQVITTVTKHGKSTIGIRYYINSIPARVKRFAQAVRHHWTIENSLHWVLDVTFGEDRSRIHKDHGQDNMASLRRLATSLLKRDTSQGSVRRKRKRAGWNDGFLLNLLARRN
jgi:predicted transposase YbfD/YdcC